MFRLPLILMIAAIAVLCATFGAEAQSCSITSTSPNFGTVNVLSGAAVDANGSLTVSCTGTANATVQLCIEFSRGNPENGTQRALESSADNFLNFDLYANAALTQIWGAWAGGNAGNSYPNGNGAGVSQTLTLNGSGSGSVTDTVYGSVFGSQQTVIPGSYTWSQTVPTVGYAYSGSCPITSAHQASSTSLTATVSSNCNVSTTSLNFGSSGTSIASAIDATATITAQCTNTSPYSIGMGQGNNYSSGSNRMANGSYYLPYGLYVNSSHTDPWTTGASNSSCTNTNDCYLGTGTGSNQNITVYGQVPAQTAPAVGTYSDTVVVTVTF